MVVCGRASVPAVVSMDGQRDIDSSFPGDCPWTTIFDFQLQGSFTVANRAESPTSFYSSPQRIANPNLNVPRFASGTHTPAPHDELSVELFSGARQEAWGHVTRCARYPVPRRVKYPEPIFAKFPYPHRPLCYSKSSTVLYERLNYRFVPLPRYG